MRASCAPHGAKASAIGLRHLDVRSTHQNRGATDVAATRAVNAGIVDDAFSYGVPRDMAP
jgi:hypothetical protein